MSDVSYRAAQEEDAALLARFGADAFAATFGHLYPAADLDAFLAQSFGQPLQAGEIRDPLTDHQLAFQNARLVGYAKLGAEKLGFAEPGRAALELHRLYVDQALHGAGVGHALMDWVLARARERGAHDLFLSVYTHNHRARRFYARYGFEEVAPYVFMVGAVADPDIVCRLRLS
ncbi:MAG: GNAT family N-acetyltransferase [Hyphomonadaceae bacterium]|nr:GNAT family N-acetyltransferase [Hyphomonadaceae bacterium]